MGLVSGIFNFLNQFSVQLGGSNSSNIWSNRRDSLFENRFETASQLQQKRDEFESFEKTKSFLIARDETQVNFIDSQIQEAREFELTPPIAVKTYALDRSGADFVNKGIGNFRNLHPITQMNVAKIEFNRQQSQAFEEYSQPIYEEINNFIKNLQSQKSLIESRSFF